MLKFVLDIVSQPTAPDPDLQSTQNVVYYRGVEIRNMSGSDLDQAKRAIDAIKSLNTRKD